MAPLARPSLEADLSARLLFAADVILADLAERASVVRLSRPELFALGVLARSPFPMRPWQLASALSCSRTNVTLLYRRLVAEGYVAEQPLWLSRGKTLSVTPAGHAAYARVTKTDARPHPLRALDERDLALLRDLLTLVQPPPASPDDAAIPPGPKPSRAPARRPRRKQSSPCTTSTREAVK
jgi:DNA-binding MarR family transcriptional regulator